MIFETVFMIRGGDFGQDFGQKLIFSIIPILICFYDWKTNDKRKDYFWVFLIASVFWALTELAIQLLGTRVLQQKFFFGINITNVLWLTIPLQGMQEAGFVAVIGMLFGDRILNKETRKKWIMIFGIFLLIYLPLYLPYGINFNNVNVGDLSIPSRRDMFTLMSVMFILIMSGFAFIWIITRKSVEVRKRGLFMWLMMALFIAWWEFLSWITGERWIEVGIVNLDGSYSNLLRAPALIEFFVLVYNVVIETSLIYVPFLALPYLSGLIKNGEM